MFLQRILRYFQGNIRFTVDGGYPEKFLNMAAASGVRLWDVGRKDTAICATTFSRNVKKIEAAAEKSGVVLHVLSRKGVPYQFKKYHKRTGIFLGVAIFAAILLFFSSFVWTIEVTGNKETSSAEILNVLYSYGVRPGAFPLLLNVKQIEQSTMMKLPGVSWLHIDIKGSRVIVRVKERVYPPDIVPESIPCNIKASQTGQILLIEPYQGQAAVKKGDAVHKGDLLVSGVIDCQNNLVRFVHANAKVIARVDHTLTVNVPYSQFKQVPTGKRETLNTLNIFAWDVPLYFKEPSGTYNRFYYQNRASIFGVSLPLAVTQTVYEKTVRKQVRLSQSEAANEAKKQIATQESIQLSNADIKSKKYESKTDKNGYTLVGKYICEEDIAVSEEIQIS